MSTLLDLIQTKVNYVVQVKILISPHIELELAGLFCVGGRGCYQGYIPEVS